MSDEFAWGRNNLDDCACPAVTAGFHPPANDDALFIAEHYDTLVEREQEGLESWGKISEEEAKEFWLRAVANLNDYDHADSKRAEAARIGEEIAEELGWS